MARVIAYGNHCIGNAFKTIGPVGIDFREVDIKENGVFGKRIESKLVAEAEDYVFIVQELKGVRHGVAVGANVQALNIHW